MAMETSAWLVIGLLSLSFLYGIWMLLIKGDIVRPDRRQVDLRDSSLRNRRRGGPAFGEIKVEIEKRLSVVANRNRALEDAERRILEAEAVRLARIEAEAALAQAKVAQEEREARQAEEEAARAILEAKLAAEAEERRKFEEEEERRRQEEEAALAIEAEKARLVAEEAERIRKEEEEALAKEAEAVRLAAEEAERISKEEEEALAKEAEAARLIIEEEERIQAEKDAERQAELDRLEAERQAELDRLEAERQEELAKLEAQRQAEIDALAAEEAATLEAQEVDAATQRELRSRIEAAGGRIGDVNVSLMWNNYNDLDLHVVCPSGERLHGGNRHSKCNGELDIDANVKPETKKPVENVVWDIGGAPNGIYKVYVHHYKKHKKRRTKDPTKFKIIVNAKGEFTEYNGDLTFGSDILFVTQFRIGDAGGSIGGMADISGPADGPETSASDTVESGVDPLEAFMDDDED
jgi:chemotaxis protein histidine kinase CheA